MQIEIACTSRNDSRKLVKEFGGRARKLPRDWLKRFARAQENRPLKIGKRLLVLSSRQKREAVSFPYSLIIPAGAAFGTGEHGTTAMSLRLLERLTRKTRPKLVVDLGTGSGLIALAAKCFGARRVVGIDVDPTAISTAKANARLNKIDNVDFQLADLRQWRPAGRIDIITANLFSGLLMQILPKLKRANWLILSGVLRAQENEFVRALRRNKIDIADVRRRGKWLAILARQLRRS